MKVNMNVTSYVRNNGDGIADILLDVASFMTIRQKLRSAGIIFDGCRVNVI